MVFDCVVRSSLQNLGYLSPFVGNLAVHQEEHPLFFLSPIRLFDLGVEVIVPAFPALLTQSGGEVFRNHSPLGSSNFLDQLDQDQVFLGCPGRLAVDGVLDVLRRFVDGVCCVHEVFLFILICIIIFSPFLISFLTKNF